WPWPGLKKLSDSGGYAVQPAWAAPLEENQLSSSTIPPNRNIQYENAFRRGNATSRAPIISGTRKLPKPARIGTTTRKIIVVPCIVMTSSYAFFVRKCWFG